MHTKPQSFLRILIFLFCALGLFGCSVYQNVTARFNTYYNAKKTFEEAVADLNRTPPAGKDTNYFIMQPVRSDGQGKFDKVIEKCSKVLQNYPQSNLVDDAIVMIGESFVYIGEYESAIRKFKELQENFPESERRYEAKLWEAKAQYYNNKTDEAIRVVEELVPIAMIADENDIVLEAIMLEAQIYFNKSDYIRAIEQYEKAITIDGSKSKLTVAYFLLAQSYQRLNNYKKAGETYASLLKLRPEPNLRFRVTLQYGKMNVLQKNFTQALQTFDDLKYDAVKREDLALVEVEIANTYNTMGDTTTAFPMYNRIDTVYRRTDASAKSNYQRGLYFENIQYDYRKAYDYYSKAQNEFPTSEITLSAKLKSDRFLMYFKLKTNISNYDSLLWLAAHPDTTKKMNDTSLVANDSTNMKNNSNVPGDSNNIANDKKSSKKTDNFQTAQLRSDSIAVKQKKTTDSFSPYLSHRGRGHMNYEDGGPEEGISTDNEYSPGNTRGARRGKDGVVNSVDKNNDVVGTVALSRAATLTPDSLFFLRIQCTYELGGLLMLEIDKPDSALMYYEQVVSEDSTKKFIPRALYALAESHRAKNDSSTVDSLYNRILNDYPKSEYAGQVKKLMGKEQSVAEIDSVEVQYKEAEKLLTSGKTKESLKMFKALSLKKSTSPILPKAQYAVGWIYENILVENDSAAQWYRQLIQTYPTSIYASTAKPKVAVKDHPDSLSQYVNLKEIPLVAKQLGVRKNKGAVSDEQGNGDQKLPQFQRKRGAEEPDEEQDPIQDEPTDDSTNDDDDNN